MTQQISDYLNQIRELSALVFAREKHWGTASLELSAGAEAAAIEELSAAQPFPLPPSYRHFLAISDGCLNFWPDFALLGTSGQAREDVEAEIEDARETLEPGLAKFGSPSDPEAIRQFEQRPVPEGTPPYRYLPAHTVFAANGAGAFYFFDETAVSAEGEPEVVYYAYDSRAKFRFPSFLALLAAKVTELEDRIREKGYR